MDEEIIKQGDVGPSEMFVGESGDIYSPRKGKIGKKKG